MNEREELVKDLAQEFLTRVIDQVDRELIDENEWDKTQILLDVCVECISKLHTAHKVMHPAIGNGEWMADQIISDIQERLEFDSEEVIVTAIN
jgi:hypothetical protein